MPALLPQIGKGSSLPRQAFQGKPKPLGHQGQLALARRAAGSTASRMRPDQDWRFTVKDADRNRIFVED